jgi:hypothetical protein
MKTDWAKHLKTPEEKTRFHNTVVAARPVLERLSDLLTSYQAAQEKSLSNYDSPSWAYKAADVNGFNRAVSTIKELITLDQEKDTYIQ